MRPNVAFSYMNLTLLHTGSFCIIFNVVMLGFATVSFHLILSGAKKLASKSN